MRPYSLQLEIGGKQKKLQLIWQFHKIVNPGKHHAMVLGTTEHKFSFPVEDSLDLLGVTIQTIT